MKRRRLLVVRNSAAIARLEADLGQGLNADVCGAEGVSSVVALIKVHRPAAILVYADSPRGEVYRLLDRLRGKARTASPPVLVLANSVDVGYELRCEGAAAYLVEPCPPAAVLAALRPLFSDGRAGSPAPAASSAPGSQVA